MMQSACHVLIFTPLGQGGRGGIDRAMDELRHYFHTASNANIEPHFITTRGPGSVWLSPFYLLGALASALVLKLRGCADVAHINLSVQGSAHRKMIVGRWLRLLSIGYVVHMHGSGFSAFWDAAPPLLAKGIETFFAHSRGIIVLGSSSAAYFADKMVQTSIPITVLYNASRSIPQRHTPRSHAGLRILFLGRIGKRKGVPQLIEALAALKTMPDWTALIAGDGDVEAATRAIAECGLSDRVDVTTWLSDQHVQDALAGADILALPSFEETLPMALVEAFANGLAVVTTPVGVIPDIVKEGFTGLLVPPGDVKALVAALERLLSDRGLRICIEEAARNFHAEHLEIGKQAEKLAIIWRGAAGVAP